MTFNEVLEATEGLSGVAYLSCGLIYTCRTCTIILYIIYGTIKCAFIHHLLLWVYDNAKEVTNLNTPFQCASVPAEQPNNYCIRAAYTWAQVQTCQTTRLAPELHSGSFHSYTPCIWIVISTTLMKQSPQSQIAQPNTNCLQVQSNTKILCQFNWGCDSPGNVCACNSLLQQSIICLT